MLKKTRRRNGKDRFLIEFEHLDAATLEGRLILGFFRFIIQ